MLPSEHISMNTKGAFPQDMRVVLVDDEYDKGFDAVLLAMLFGVCKTGDDDILQRDGELLYAP